MICKQCKTEFFKKYSKWCSGDFCSKKCANVFSRKHFKPGTKIVKCITCQKEIEVDKRASSKQCKCDDCRINKNKYNNKICSNCNRKIKTGKFCNHKCKNDYNYKNYIILWKNEKINGMSGFVHISNHIRRYLFEKYENKCCKCGWNETNTYTNKIPLQINHIDGNHENNNENNLELLCPNCHSLTENFGSRNIKFIGRHSKIKKRKLLLCCNG